MKKGYRVLTSVLIIGILFMTGGSAMAGWAVNAGTTQKVITNGGNSSSFVQVGTLQQPAFLTATGQSMSQNGIISLTLTGGATFSTTAGTGNLFATCSSGSAAALIDPASVPGTATARFLLTSTSGIQAGEIITFATTGTAINVTGVAAGSSVDFLISYTTVGNISLVTNSSMYSAGTGVGGTYAFEGKGLIATTYTLQTATADVKATSGPYTKFENDAVRGGVGGTNSANLVLTNNSGQTNTLPSAGLAKYKLLITLTGDFTGISKVTCDASLTGSDASGSTAGGTQGQFLINSTKTVAYATNNVVLSSASISTNPEFYIDGTTVQAERSFQAKVENFVDGAIFNATTWTGPVKYFTIARNGVFFTSNSTGTYNTIKISDKSGSVPTGGAKVMISAYDAAGTKLAEAAGNADILIQNNQTITLTGDVLAARFVGTPMKYEVAVTTTSGAITNVKKTPEGFGSNVWTINGGTL